MKLSSISLIAVAVVAFSGSATAAPTPRPFERGVNIYSRAGEQAVASFKSSIRNWHAHEVAHAMGRHDHSEYFKNVALSNHKDMKRLTNPMHDGSSGNLSTKDSDFAKATHKSANNYIARTQKDGIAIHEEAAERARQVAHDVKELGDRGAKLVHAHLADAEKNDKYAKDHREALKLGHTSDLSSTGLAYDTHVRVNDTYKRLSEERQKNQLAGHAT